MLSAWKKGVLEYADDLLATARGNGVKGQPSAKQLLNGAQDWREYSYGGYALISNADICARLATPSERRRKQDGLLPPNSRETWLDVQARALREACGLIISGEYTDDFYDSIKENQKFPQHQYRAVVGFTDCPVKVAYFMAQHRAKQWAEQARTLAGHHFKGYQITRRVNGAYIYKEGR